MEITKQPNKVPLDEIEKRVWQDISRARASHALLQQFLNPLGQKSSSHFRNRDVSLTNAIAHAAVDSIISALGRLLQPNPKERESTISKYRNEIVAQLKGRSTAPGESGHSIQSFNQLSDRQWINHLKKQQKKFTEELLPLRNKLVAHSEIGFNWSLFTKAEKSIATCIDFVEQVHRTCRSALDDAANPGPYLDGCFGSVAQDWIDALLNRR